mmetsp:Transcript_66051/g.130196  ORF Transcript_66051/g.130196 Transcript_66051/m.130196 type:complete len:100 (-) Transcript_66051:58-357(-)
MRTGRTHMKTDTSRFARTCSSTAARVIGTKGWSMTTRWDLGPFDHTLVGPFRNHSMRETACLEGMIRAFAFSVLQLTAVGGDCTICSNRGSRKAVPMDI